jgi:hypothetical protein
MKLINAILRPGEILEVLENGKIKASAPGLFSDSDNPVLLPPIMPFWELMGSHPNIYSTPIVGDEIWVLNLTDNPLQLYWFRKDPHIDNNKDIFLEAGETPVEILCNIESGVGYASLFFSDGTGWVLKNDQSRLQIDANGDVIMTNGFPNRNMIINTNGVYLGVDLDNLDDTEKTHPVTYADELMEVLNQLCGVLELTAIAAGANPYTMALQMPLNKVANVKKLIPNIESPHVKIG